MKKKNVKQKLIVGWREWAQLPDLDVDLIKIKIDTGARTSSMHAFDISPFTYMGQPWVKFDVHPLQDNDELSHTCTCPVIDFRWITSSTGHRQKRYIIRSRIQIGEFITLIDISLANRDEMGFRFLLGRNAMKGQLLVDPSHSFLLTHKQR